MVASRVIVLHLARTASITSKASFSCSSVIESGGRKRSTLP